MSETPARRAGHRRPSTPRLERRAEGRLAAGVCRGLAEHLGLETDRRTPGVRGARLGGRGRRRVRRALAPRAPARRARGAARPGPALRVRGAGRRAVAVHVGRRRAELGRVAGRRGRHRRRDHLAAGRPRAAAALGAQQPGDVAAQHRRRAAGRRRSRGVPRPEDPSGAGGPVLLGSTVVLAGVAVVVAPWLLRHVARPGHRAPRAHPLPGARRGRRARTRLGAAHAHADPAQRAGPAGGPAAGPRARNATCAPGSTSRRPTPSRTSPPPYARPPPRSRTTTACRSRSSASATARSTTGSARCSRRRARPWSTPPSTPETTVGVGYAEVAGDDVAIFVRDRGKGFDLDAVPEDRMGVRESIIGRMERNGGKVAIRTAPGEGTEVRLEMTRDRKTT